MLGRRLLTAIGSPPLLYGHGRVELTPQLLFLLTMAGLTLLYTLEFAIGGERGAASPFDVSETMPEASKAASTEVAVDARENSTVAAASNSTSAKTRTPETSSPRVANDLYSLFVIGLIVFGAVMFMFLLFQKVAESIRVAYFGQDGYNGATTSRGAMLRNRVVAMQLLERLRGTGLRNMLGRDITPDDYEALLGLDNNNANNVDMGVSQGLINRCPVMIITQEQIDRMTKNDKSDVVKKDDGMPAPINDNADDTDDTDNIDSEFSCTVCLGDFRVGDAVRTLPCLHFYHRDCIDPWLLEHGNCPICKIRLDEA